MAFPLCNSPLLLLFFVVFFFFSFSGGVSSSDSNSLNPVHTEKPYVSFPLFSRRVSHRRSSPLFTSSLSASPRNTISRKTPTPSKFRFKYTTALVISFPIGTPPQPQPMVLDTGSQLSWIQCQKKPLKLKRNPSFNPSLSSSFSVLHCKTPFCSPRSPDFSLPTSCDSNHLCHYSFFYADGTLAEGNLVQEKVSLVQRTSTVVLGCSLDSSSPEGILGMNLGRLSFASQASIRKFSYCVPARRNLTQVAPRGTFVVGDNPLSSGFKYVNLLHFSQTQSSLPYLDKAAYTVAMTGIRIAGKRLDIPPSAFLPDAGGAGQTMIDSGTEFTFLVEDAYAKVKEEVRRLVGPRWKKGFVYGGVLETCFVGDVAHIGRLLGEVVLELKGAEIALDGERALVGVGGGVTCLTIGSSQLLGVESNIIGNFHQQNMWVEFDGLRKKVGFAKADCSKAL